MLVALAPAQGLSGEAGAGNLVPAMTRYSRSVIPGRAPEGDGAHDESLDRAVFGAKKKPITPPANDREDYPDPMDMDVDEAGHLVDRTERRKADDRRKPTGERRKASDRRSPDFPPLRENGVAYRTADEGKRGPILLVGALVIAHWSWGLIRDAGRVLVDAAPENEELRAEILEALEPEDARVTDLHIWQVGPGHHAAIVALASPSPKDVAHYKDRLGHIHELSHVTVEVVRLAGAG